MMLLDISDHLFIVMNSVYSETDTKLSLFASALASCFNIYKH